MMVLIPLIAVRLDCFKTFGGKGTWENRAAVHETEGLSSRFTPIGLSMKTEQ